MFRRTPFLILIGFLLCILLTACQQEPAKELVGKWRTDLGGDNGMMIVEFREDGSFETRFTNSPNLVSLGTYLITSENQIEITTETGDGQSRTVKMEYSINDTTLKLTTNGESQLFLQLPDE